MTATKLARSQLLAQFREFYTEVIRLKRQAQLAGAGGDSEADIWQRLLSVLERQALDAERFGRAQASFYGEAQYAMAALGDEIFVYLDWSGRDQWRNNLLESRLFGSHIAGESFFQRLDRLLQGRDAAYTELAAVYLFALALGFRGRYYGIDDSGRLDRYRRELYSFISGHEPDMANATRRLFPELLPHTLAGAEAHKLPDARRWLYAAGAVVLAFLVISHIVWLQSTSELRATLSGILGR